MKDEPKPLLSFFLTNLTILTFIIAAKLLAHFNFKVKFRVKSKSEVN